MTTKTPEEIRKLTINIEMDKEEPDPQIKWRWDVGVNDQWLACGNADTPAKAILGVLEDLRGMNIIQVVKST